MSRPLGKPRRGRGEPVRAVSHFDLGAALHKKAVGVLGGYLKATDAMANKIKPYADRIPSIAPQGPSRGRKNSRGRFGR